jgi:hypothetical protein
MFGYGYIPKLISNKEYRIAKPKVVTNSRNFALSVYNGCPPKLCGGLMKDMDIIIKQIKWLC